jgi:hypothetical protein
MSGNPIEHLKIGVQEVLHLLDENDKFNIVKFGSNYKFFSDKMLQATYDNIQEAQDYVSNINANMGGTEAEVTLLKTIEHIVQSELQCDILFITDGDVYKIENITSKALEHKIKIFPLGVCDSPNFEILDTLAQKTNGIAKYVTANESIANIITKHYYKMGTLNIKKVKVKNTFLQYNQYPKNIISYENETTNLYMQYKDNKHEPIILEVTYANNTTQDITIEPQQVMKLSKNIPIVSKLVASQLIKNTQPIQSIIDTALKYSLISKHTSFIGTYKRDKKIISSPYLIKIKSMPTHFRPRSIWTGISGFSDSHTCSSNSKTNILQEYWFKENYNSFLNNDIEDYALVLNSMDIKYKTFLNQLILDFNISQQDCIFILFVFLHKYLDSTLKDEQLKLLSKNISNYQIIYQVIEEQITKV